MTNRCPYPTEDIMRARDLPALEWTKRMSHEIRQWRPFGNDVLWAVDIAKSVCDQVRDARRRENHKMEKSILVIGAAKCGWGNKQPGEAAVDYVARMVDRLLTKWMRLADPAASPRTARAERDDKALFGVRRPNLDVPHTPLSMGDKTVRILPPHPKKK